MRNAEKQNYEFNKNKAAGCILNHSSCVTQCLRERFQPKLFSFHEINGHHGVGRGTLKCLAFPSLPRLGDCHPCQGVLLRLGDTDGREGNSGGVTALAHVLPYSAQPLEPM